MPLSPSGRLAPLPFAVAVVVVYLLSFGSQVLLSGPVMARLSVLPFVLVQAVLIWIWIVLHIRRLRDAGRSGGLAVGVAMVYGLEVLLLTSVVWLLFAATADGAGSESGILQLFVILYLLTLLAEPGFGALQLWLMAYVALMLLPILIALGFSLWAATRPVAPAGT